MAQKLQVESKKVNLSMNIIYINNYNCILVLCTECDHYYLILFLFVLCVCVGVYICVCKVYMCVLRHVVVTTRAEVKTAADKSEHVFLLINPFCKGYPPKKSLTPKKLVLVQPPYC